MYKRILSLMVVIMLMVAPVNAYRQTDFNEGFFEIPWASQFDSKYYAYQYNYSIAAAPDIIIVTGKQIGRAHV